MPNFTFFRQKVQKIGHNFSFSSILLNMTFLPIFFAEGHSEDQCPTIRGKQMAVSSPLRKIERNRGRKFLLGKNSGHLEIQHCQNSRQNTIFHKTFMRVKLQNCQFCICPLYIEIEPSGQP